MYIYIYMWYVDICDLLFNCVVHDVVGLYIYIYIERERDLHIYIILLSTQLRRTSVVCDKAARKKDIFSSSVLYENRSRYFSPLQRERRWKNLQWNRNQMILRDTREHQKTSTIDPESKASESQAPSLITCPTEGIKKAIFHVELVSNTCWTRVELMWHSCHSRGNPVEL